MKAAQRPRTGDAAWECEFCNRKYVIPDLARQCEDRHLDAMTEKAQAK